jgi:capsular exopolysaccharide synthesis family protein
MNTDPSRPANPPAPPAGSAYYDHPAYGAPPTGWAWLSPRRLLRKWRTIALAMVFAALVAAGYLWSAQKIYLASSLVELSVRRPRILTQQAAVIEDQGGGTQAAEIFNTRLERFKGRSMLRAALARLDAACPGQFFPPSQVVPGFSAAELAETNATTTAAIQEHLDKQREIRLKKFERALTLTLIRRSSLIRVEFEHPDPAVAAAACNAFAETAEASAYEENRTSSDAAVVWLEAQAELQRAELMKAEDALLDYRRQHKIDAMESQRKTVEDALLEFNRALVIADSAEGNARALLAKMDTLRLDPELEGELPSDIPRADEIRAALEKWRGASVARDGLLATFTPKHPEVQAQDNLVVLYRSQALQALERAKATAQANQRLLVDQADSLRSKKDEQGRLAAKLEIQIVERRTRLAALERARDAADQSYRGILTRIQDARMAADENTATIKIVEKASVPAEPIRPQPLRTLALALFLGLLLGVGAVVVLDVLEDRVAGPEDLEGHGVPVLAVVPHMKGADRTAVASASIHQKLHEVVEAFAGLGNMLDSPRFKEQSQVLLVASSIPGEGKTVTSCNLAAALAKKGRRVLLVDFDLRRPRLAGIFPMPAQSLGLLDALTRNIGDFERLVYSVAACPKLDVIASRPNHAASPLEAVGAPAAAGLLEWARGKYDHVVMDAPPLGIVGDTLALAPLADFILVAVRPEVSRKRLTLHTLQRLRDSGIHALGMVVNDLDISKFSYGSYSPYYHYSQHYKTYAPAAAAAPAERT